MVIIVRYQQKFDSVYENNTVMVITVLYQQSVYMKTTLSLGDYCPLSTKCG